MEHIWTRGVQNNSGKVLKKIKEHMNLNEIFRIAETCILSGINKAQRQILTVTKIMVSMATTPTRIRRQK